MTRTYERTPMAAKSSAAGATVEIDLGELCIPGVIWRRAQTMLEELLTSVGLTGSWAAKPQQQVRMRGASLRVTAMLGQLRLRVRPGNNSTAWEWRLFPPSGIDADYAQARISEYLSRDLEPEMQPEPPVVLPPAPQQPAPNRLPDPHVWSAPNPPPAPQPLPKPPEPLAAPAAKIDLGAILARIEETKAAYAGYSARQAEIEALNKQWEALGAKIEKLEKVHAEDVQGRAAAQILQQLSNTLGT